MTQNEALDWLKSVLTDESGACIAEARRASWRDGSGIYLKTGDLQGPLSGQHLFLDVTVLDANTVEREIHLDGNGKSTRTNFISLLPTQAAALARLVDSAVECYPAAERDGLTLADYQTLSTTLWSTAREAQP